MKINLSEAVGQFYTNPSLDLVYFEAIANSLDAKATEIQLNIQLNSFEEAHTLEISVEDNGEGFNKRGYGRFCKLLETDNPNNKGIGRLIFLHYFSEGIYNTCSKEFQRSFILNKGFDSEYDKTCNLEKHGTKLELKGYKLQKINRYDYVRAEALKKSIELHFLPRLFLLKKSGVEVDIYIKVDTKNENSKQGFYTDSRTISTKNLPVLKEKNFKVPDVDLFHDFNLFYLVEKNYENHDFKIAVTSDTRTVNLSSFISKDNIPESYNCVFIVQSEYFEGKTTNSRQRLNIDEKEFRSLKRAIIQEIRVILEQEIPNLIEKNQQQKDYLYNKYPHLIGLFEDEVVGLIDRDKLIDKAQARFFKEQKKVLEAETMDDMHYEKSLEVSSRVLTEYILYRNLIIQKLKEISKDNNESDVHDLIIPMREKYRCEDKFNHLYRNNAWLLDDKFMTYSTILSDKSLQNLIDEIKVEDELVIDKNTKPDISIVFNGNPEIQNVDVVVIEIKPRYEELHQNEKAIRQIERRARRLLEYYPTHIQRIWFYAIVDIDREFELSLKTSGYKEVFSSGKTYFRTQEIFYFDKQDKEHSNFVDITVLSYEAMLNDAQSRNDTFLDILKETIKKQSK